MSFSRIPIRLQVPGQGKWNVDSTRSRGTFEDPTPLLKQDGGRDLYQEGSPTTRSSAHVLTCCLLARLAYSAAWFSSARRKKVDVMHPSRLPALQSGTRLRPSG